MTSAYAAAHGSAQFKRSKNHIAGRRLWGIPYLVPITSPTTSTQRLSGRKYKDVFVFEMSIPRSLQIQPRLVPGQQSTAPKTTDPKTKGAWKVLGTLRMDGQSQGKTPRWRKTCCCVLRDCHHAPRRRLLGFVEFFFFPPSQT